MGDSVVDDLSTHAVAEHHERLAATRLLVLMGLSQFVEESLRNSARLGCGPAGAQIRKNIAEKLTVRPFLRWFSRNGAKPCIQC